ncbi:MAG: hypothetical protein ACR2JK_02605 [Geodermatophilaceae bacterium]
MPEPDPARPMRAVGRGGPMDGAVLGAADQADFEVVMADASRHRYVRTDVLASRGPEPTREFSLAGRLQVPPVR